MADVLEPDRSRGELPYRAGAAPLLGNVGPEAAPESHRLRIVRVVVETERIVSIELEREDGALLPSWEAGAHLNIRLPSGRIRQYSLCGDPEDRSHYRIAVLREGAGRGGSTELHALARPGALLDVRGPRNNFPLIESERYLFLAGGIGITPLMPMVLAAERGGRPWILIYAGRTRGSMAFAADLARRTGGRLRIVPSSEMGRIDFDDVLAFLQPGTLVYACGPSAMLGDIEGAASRHGRSDRLHIERFSASPHVSISPERVPDRAFEVELQRSGLRLHVPPDRTLGSVLREAGATVEFSCEEGCCGICETRVLAGIPDHRDCILSDQEKAGSDRMMVCVGRAVSATLVLDL